MPDFKKELKKAKEFYFKVWRGNEKPCPAFDGEIIEVTKAGWSHIVFSAKRNKHIFSVFSVKPFTQKRKTPLPLGLLGLNLSP